MRKQIRSITCGCGECATRQFVADTCPLWNSKEAIQLWCSDPNDNGEPDESILDQVSDIIEEVTREPEDLLL
jgi:hypothetical protein